MDSLPLREFVEDHLYDDQSPEAIAGRLKQQQKKLPYASKNSIYRYITSPYGRRIEYYRHTRRKRRRRHIPRLKLWGNKKSIDDRPEAINRRSRTGDAEMDFIVSGKSGQGVLFVVVDRKHRVTFIEQILRPTTKAVEKAALKMQERYPEWQTATTDNDLLWQHHEALEQALGIALYFCHSYHSWKKGSVENANKYIRRDIPKRSDISTYPKTFIRSVEEKLNRRMMKCLNYRTPTESLARSRKQKRRRSVARKRKKKK